MTTEQLLKAEAQAQCFANLLEAYLKKRFRCRKPRVTRPPACWTVNASTTKYDLYFRVTPPGNKGWPDDTLVIASIAFDEQRRGHGTDLMRFLVGVSAEVGFTHIAIETAGSKAFTFGAKFGLEQFGEGRDMRAHVDAVAQRLLQ